MLGHEWLPGAGLLVFIDDVAADESSRMNSEVFSRHFLLTLIELAAYATYSQN